MIRMKRGNGGSRNRDDNVPNANWNRDNRQANLDRNDPENSDPNIGVRGAVRD